jgi:hypothetical protein
LLGRILPSSDGNTSGGIVSDPSTEAFSEEGAETVVDDASSSLEFVLFDDDANAGVISISCDCDSLSDNGAADKSTANRKNVVDVISFDKTVKTIVLVTKCDKKEMK